MPEMDFYLDFCGHFLVALYNMVSGIQFGSWCQQAHSLASGQSDALCEVGKKSPSILFFFWLIIRAPKIISESLMGSQPIF